MNVLIVEDNKSHSLDIEMALIDCEIYDIKVARSISKANEFINQKCPDIAFIDLVLNEGSGHEIIPLLKSKGTYVIVVTGFSSTKNMRKSIGLNADAFLTKPVTQEEIQFVTYKAIETLKTDTKEFHVFTYYNSLIKVDIGNILYLEAVGNYTTIQLKDKKLVFKKSLKKILDEIGSKQLIRVFRSHAINKNHINTVDFSAGKITTNFEKEFALGRSYRKTLKETLKKK